MLTTRLDRLLRTPTALARVTKEIREAFKDEAEITMVIAANKLPYMLACIQEGLRIYTPAAGSLLRYVPTNETRIDDGVLVPGTTKVGVHHSAGYRSQRHFHRAMDYLPERWLPAATEPSSPFAADDRSLVQPFSVGPRKCIAQTFAQNEMRYLVARFLYRFDLVSLSPECLNWHEQRAFVIWEKRPLMVQLRARD